MEARIRASLHGFAPRRPGAPVQLAPRYRMRRTREGSVAVRSRADDRHGPQRVGRGARAQRMGGAASSFGFLTAVAMALGLVVGFVLPSVGEVASDIPMFGIAETRHRPIVAGNGRHRHGFGGGPRLLRHRRGVYAGVVSVEPARPAHLSRRSRLSQATLASFLGTFIYCLAVLTRLGSAEEERLSARTSRSRWRSYWRSSRSRCSPRSLLTS